MSTAIFKKTANRTARPSAATKRRFSLWGRPAGLYAPPPQHACSKQSPGSLPEPAGSLLCAKRNLSMRDLRKKTRLEQVVVRNTQRGLRPQPKGVFRFGGYQQVCMPPSPQHACSKQSSGSLPEPAGSLPCAKRNLSMRNLRKKTRFEQVVVRIRRAACSHSRYLCHSWFKSIDARVEDPPYPCRAPMSIGRFVGTDKDG
jgi:hypothetical protein